MESPVCVFISYAQADEQHARELEKHLGLLKRDGDIRAWHQRLLGAGLEWRQETAEQLRAARIIVLLASSDYVDSDYLHEHEMQPALARASEGAALVIPVLVRAHDWAHAPYARLKLFPRGARPVADWASRDDAWTEVATAIREEVKKLRGEQNARPAAKRIAPPVPRFEDAKIRALVLELDAARERWRALANLGRATASVDKEILDLRRQLREGGRLRAGDTLGEGRYRLIEPIGRGGFATVWSAFDRERAESVAVKVLHADLAGDPVRWERFFRGARVMASLGHEAVVRVLCEKGEDGSWLFFVMELAVGGDLRRAVVKGKVPRERAVPILLSVGGVLAEAHAKGVVHRDVKPANIVLDAFGEPRLTDFDLVAVGDTTGGTRTGAAMGSPLYMAPEQNRDAKTADARADVYGLGMTALFCLHGGELPTIVWRRPDMVIDALACSDRVKEVVTRAIEVEPEKRFKDAREFCDALREAVLPRPAPEPDKEPARPEPQGLRATDRVIAIDLGTTKSVVAILEGNMPTVIANDIGARLTPTIVAYDDQGKTLVGWPARRQAVTNSTNTVYSAMRLLGRRFEDVTGEVARVPYKIIRGKDSEALVEIRGERVAPREILAKVLERLKNAAEDYLGVQVTDAVITVPSYFKNVQRQAIKDAGRIAGLEVKRLINSPAAAAMAYGFDRKSEELIAVYDFGGGTFDISIIEVGDGVVQVVSTNGDTRLGGDDIDYMVRDWLVAEFRKDTGIDVSNDKMVIQRLKEAAEQAKIELSNVQETTINLPFLTADASGPKHLQRQLTRAKLEQMIRPLIERTLEPTRKALSDAKKSPQQIHEVVLVGGSTRIPLVQETVKKFFGKDPHKGVNPDEVVAVGAAIRAGVFAGDIRDPVLLDVTPFSLGVETLGGVTTVMLRRNTTIPTQKKEMFSTATDNQSSLEVHILEGERTEARYNTTLGRFRLDGITPAPRGVPKIEVTFDIDTSDGIWVSAKDMATGKDHSIAITTSSGMKEDTQRMAQPMPEIEHGTSMAMVLAAETYRERDSQER